MKSKHINVDAKHIRRFLDSCDGNWHNCLYVSCTHCNASNKQSGFLFHPDKDGIPLLLPLIDAKILFSCAPDPGECLCFMNLTQFLSMYRDYIKKHQYPAGDCPCMTMLKEQEELNYDW